jgi:hypothetical protein
MVWEVRSNCLVDDRAGDLYAFVCSGRRGSGRRRPGWEGAINQDHPSQRDTSSTTNDYVQTCGTDIDGSLDRDEIVFP